MAVAFEHLTADVSREGLDRLLAHARILGQPGDERVPHVVGPVAHASGFAGLSPRLAPGTHWKAEVNVVEDRQARVSGHAYLVVREKEAIRPGFRETFQPQRKTSAHATRERYQAARAFRRLALRHG